MIKPLISMIIQTHWTQQFLIVTQNLIFINHLYYLMFTYELLSMLHGNTFFWNDEIAVFFHFFRPCHRPWVHGCRRFVEAAVEADLESNWAVVAEAWEILGVPVALGAETSWIPSKKLDIMIYIYIHILVLKVFILMCIYICNYIVIWINYIESGGYNCRYV
jgi:hypothetical protein